ncbi:glucosamine-6-phosphate deaminase [Salmonella enterica]|nr:glucosamine-6-phosphate deaminase [Salmonella enterica]EBN4455258.1 glucosamine-6-phosphate deaminase [Salmonella enterica]EDL1779714.1 glucosamine-6-phosphate deaminase [Salmonella enterica subsp. enterica serovar Poona]EEL6362551.1 glucosamine-6-phosphate deaminase [Salmonella enterica]
MKRGFCYENWLQGYADAPRDKCAHFREINGTAAAFQYLQKNYNPTASSFL